MKRRRHRRIPAVFTALFLTAVMLLGGLSVTRPLTAQAAEPGVQLNALTFGNMEGYRMFIVELVATEDFQLEVFGGILTWKTVNGGPEDELSLASVDWFEPNLPSFQVEGSDYYDNAARYHFANVISTTGPVQVHSGDVLARWALETSSGRLNCDIAYIFNYEVEANYRDQVDYLQNESWATGTSRSYGYTVEHMWKWDETVSPGTTHVGFTWEGPENAYTSATAHYDCISCGQKYPLGGCIIKRTDTLPEVGKAGNIHFFTWVDEIVSPDGLGHDGWLDVSVPPLDPPPETAPPETPSETQPPETQPSETQPPETIPPETAPPETAPPETKPSETAPPETAPSETAPPETKPSEAPPETKSSESASESTSESESGTPGDPEKDPGEPGKPGPFGLSKGGVWALVNLICMIVTVIVALGMIETMFAGRDDRVKRRRGESREEFARRKEAAKNDSPAVGFKLLGVFPAAASVLLFLYTEDLSKPMVLTDKWTIAMAVILAIAFVLAIVTRRRRKKDKKKDRDE